jgi:hypothetical protein
MLKFRRLQRAKNTEFKSDYEKSDGFCANAKQIAVMCPNRSRLQSTFSFGSGGGPQRLH